jgi:hypothetical protein
MATDVFRLLAVCCSGEEDRRDLGASAGPRPMSYRLPLAELPVFGNTEAEGLQGLQGLSNA